MSEGKSTIKWIVGGCGCLVLLIIVAAVGIFAAGWMATERALEEAGLGDFAELKEAAEGIEQMQRDSNPNAPKSETMQIADRLDDDAVDAAEIETMVSEPMTRQDVEDYVETIDAVRDSEAFAKVKGEVDKIKEIESKGGEKKGMLDSLRTAKGAMSAYGAVGDVMKILDREIEERGGYQSYYGRVAKVSGVIVAAQAHAVGGDPASDATAKKLLKLRPERVAEVDKAYASLDEAAEQGTAIEREELQGMVENLSKLRNPADVALARLPKETFEAWAALPVELRQRAIAIHSPKGEWGKVVASTSIGRGEAFLLLIESEKLKKYEELFQQGGTE